MNEIIDDISDKIFIIELKKEFIDSISKNVEKLIYYHRSDSYSGMRSIIHDFKGIGDIFGFKKGTGIAEKLLKSIDSNKKKEKSELCLEFIKYLNEVVLNKKLEE